MLGEQIGEFTGKVTSTRILPGDDYRYVKMEMSVEQTGTLLGMPAQDIGTITAFERVPGQVFGQGLGMMYCEAGGVIWEGHSITAMSGEGFGGTTRFSAVCQAPSEGPLARLNSVVVLGEQTTDGEGNVTTKLWEWR